MSESGALHIIRNTATDLARKLATQQVGYDQEENQLSSSANCSNTRHIISSMAPHDFNVLLKEPLFDVLTFCWEAAVHTLDQSWKKIDVNFFLLIFYFKKNAVGKQLSTPLINLGRKWTSFFFFLNFFFNVFFSLNYYFFLRPDSGST